MRKFLVMLVGLMLALSVAAPAHAAYSGSVSKGEYDFAYGGLTRSGFEDGVAAATGVVQSDDTWPGTNDPRRIVRYYVYYNGSVHTGSNWGAFMYYRQYTSGGPWKLCAKELWLGFGGPSYSDFNLC